MKFSVNAKNFVQSIEPAVIVADKGGEGGIEDIESRYRMTLDASKEKLTIMAYGGYVSISTSIDSDLDNNVDYSFAESGMATINAYDFKEALRSFDENEKIIISLSEEDGDELYIKRSSDTEQFQTLPVYADDIELPKLSSKFQKEITLSKDIFVETANKILFAVGWEENDTKKRYLSINMETHKDKILFMAGDSRRFVCEELEKENITNGDFVFSIPGIYLSTSLRAMKSSDVEDIIIKQSESEKDDPNIREQVVLEYGNTQIVIMGIDSSYGTYNDSVKKVINMDPLFSVKTQITDWEPTIKGLRATQNIEYIRTHNIHNSRIKSYCDKQYLQVSTDKTQLKSKRKVSIEEIDQGGEIDFTCNTQHLLEVVKYFSKSKKIDFQTVSYQPNTPLIVVVKSDSDFNEGNGVTYNSCVFFATTA